MQITSDEMLKSRLLEAYEADPDRSKIGRLRKQFDTINDLKRGGMSLTKILAVLNEGKTKEESLTMKTFNGYLYLLRKERGEMRVRPSVLPVAGPAPSRAKSKNAGKNKAKNPATPDILDEGKEVESNSIRPPPLLSDDKAVWGKLKPSPVDGTADLKQK